MTDNGDNLPTEKMNIVDSASLAFFTNPHYLSILQRKKICNLKDNAEEIKFYRKRIIALFKDMLKEEVMLNGDIKEIHDLFVNAAVRYFEITDKKDIVQGQHINENELQSITSSDELSPEDLLNTLGGTELYTIHEANDMMMRKTIAVANLDNYVINKTDSSANNRRIIPMKLEMDLKTNELKIKGIPPKKHKKSKKMKEDLSNLNIV